MGTGNPGSAAEGLRQLSVLTATWGGELSELFIPLWAPPPDGTATHDQPHRLCQIRT